MHEYADVNEIVVHYGPKKFFGITQKGLVLIIFDTQNPEKISHCLFVNLSSSPSKCIHCAKMLVATIVNINNRNSVIAREKVNQFSLKLK